MSLSKNLIPFLSSCLYRNSISEFCVGFQEEYFHRPPTDVELDYGKINGWPALKVKTMKDNSRDVGGEDDTVEGSVFSESAPTGSPTGSESKSEASASSSTSSSDTNGSDSESESENDSSESGSGNSL